jgi:hypothetical protein
VYDPAERADTLSLFNLNPYLYSAVWYRARQSSTPYTEIPYKIIPYKTADYITSNAGQLSTAE